jgi:hypothetical protein
MAKRPKPIPIVSFDRRRNTEVYETSYVPGIGRVSPTLSRAIYTSELG